MTEVVLETRDLMKEFHGFVAVSGVNLQIRAGAIHALIGPNGAGKTTVFNLITRFLTPTSGSILFRGEDITEQAPAMIACQGIVRSFQVSAVFSQLTALRNLTLALQRPYVSPIRFWRSGRQLRALDERAREILDLVDLGPYTEELAGRLPYGRKRALELATTLAANPAVMLLDEPTQGLGHEDVDRVAELIRRMASNRTVLMVEHNMGIVSRIANRITVLQRGQVIAEGSYTDIANDPQVIEAYLGSSAAPSGGGKNGRH